MRSKSILVLFTILFSCVYAEAGLWTTIDVPGKDGTTIYGINGSNLVGTYSGVGGTRGFAYDGTDWTYIDAPGATRIWVYGIDGNNMVGNYNDASGPHGFLYDGDS